MFILKFAHGNIKVVLTDHINLIGIIVCTWTMKNVSCFMISNGGLAWVILSKKRLERANCL